MNEYVRVKLDDGAITTVGREFAEMHNLKAVDGESGLDRYGRPLPEEHPDQPVDEAVLEFNLDTANVDQLRAEIDRRNGQHDREVPLAKGRSKADLQDVLRADDARHAAAGAVNVSGNDEVETAPSGQVVVTGQADA